MRTFLIADIRGYTTYTRESGDEAAATLARSFAEICERSVERHDGHVIELRGDEALAVFSSARQALAAALELQGAVAGSGLPRGVGIGIDSGEAIAVGDGFRGSALNLAARLCAQAAAGEILASEAAVHVAGKVQGVAYSDTRTLKLKGFDDPVQAVRIVAEDMARTGPIRALRRFGRRHRGWVGAVAAVALAAMVALVVLLAPGGRGASPATGTTPSETDAQTQGGVAMIDPDTGHVLSTIDLPGDPSSVAFGEGSVWVTDGGGSTVSRIDPSTRHETRIEVGASPNGIAIGDSVWVANELDGTISQIDPLTNAVHGTVDFGVGPGLNTIDVAVDDQSGAVWAAVGSADQNPNHLNSFTLYRIDPTSDRATKVWQGGCCYASVLVAGGGSVWFIAQNGLVVRFDARTASVLEKKSTGRQYTAAALGTEDLWLSWGSGGPADPIATYSGGEVASLHIASYRLGAAVPVGGAPAGMALTQTSVFVADAHGSVVSFGLLDPTVQPPIALPGSVVGIAFGDNVLWAALDPG